MTGKLNYKYINSRRGLKYINHFNEHPAYPLVYTKAFWKVFQILRILMDSDHVLMYYVVQRKGD